MLSSALVVFREVFEIVLIVGIVMAATQGIPHRKKSIYLGFGGGILGSALVAIFTSRISEFADGMGQEYFNALILFTASAFIGWTLIWMKRHAREMRAHFTKVGQDVASGRLPFFSISFVIALAILREGAEIALFSYGMLATGQSPASLAAGFTIGMSGGILVGVLLYFGLLKISTRAFFQITSWLLVFVVSGMMAQGIGFLTSAGLFESLSFTVWDSSWLLEDGTLTSDGLKALVGYTAQPSAIQLIVYALTLFSLFFFLRFSGNPKKVSISS